MLQEVGAKPPGAAPRLALILFCLVIVLAPIGIWSFATYRLHESASSQARERLLRTTDLLAEHADKAIESQVILARHIASLVSDAKADDVIGDEARYYERLKFFVDATEQLQDIWVLDADGRPLVTTTFKQAPRDMLLADREYFRIHKSGERKPGEIYVSELLRGRADPSKLFFQISLGRYASSGEFLGVVALSLEPEYFRHFYAQASRGGFAAITLTRSDGKILVRTPPLKDEFLSMPAGSGFMTATGKVAERGLYDALSVFDQVDRVVAYRRLSHLPLYVTASIDKQDIRASWFNQSMSYLYFGIPATLLVLLLATYAHRQHTAALEAYRALSDAAMQRQAMAARMHHAEKLEAVGRLTATVAHDFNNFIAGIGAALRLVAPHVPPETRAHLALTHANGAIDTATGIVKQLLSFSGQTYLQMSTVDVTLLVEQVASFVRLSGPSSIEVITYVPTHAFRIQTDKTLLESALVNLCTNARHALPTGGRIELSVKESQRRLNGGGAVDCCEITVQDNGVGMSPDVLKKAVDPFFTTKGARTGTGLGLSQVQGFVQQCGGELVLESELGVGTKVTMYLPKHPPALLGGAGPGLAEPDSQLGPSSVG